MIDDSMENLFAEFGCIEKVRFADSSQVQMKDGEGNIVKCGKCNKDAVGALMGLTYCHDHAPYGGKDASLGS